MATLAAFLFLVLLGITLPPGASADHRLPAAIAHLLPPSVQTTLLGQDLNPNTSVECPRPDELARCSWRLIGGFLDIIVPVHTPVQHTTDNFCRTYRKYQQCLDVGNLYTHCYRDPRVYYYDTLASYICGQGYKVFLEVSKCMFRRMTHELKCQQEVGTYLEAYLRFFNDKNHGAEEERKIQQWFMCSDLALMSCAAVWADGKCTTVAGDWVRGLTARLDRVYRDRLGVNTTCETAAGAISYSRKNPLIASALKNPAAPPKPLPTRRPEASRPVADGVSAPPPNIRCTFKELGVDMMTCIADGVEHMPFKPDYLKDPTQFLIDMCRNMHLSTCWAPFKAVCPDAADSVMQRTIDMLSSMCNFAALAMRHHCDVPHILSKYNNDTLPCNSAEAYSFDLALHVIHSDGFPDEYWPDEKTGKLFYELGLNLHCWVDGLRMAFTPMLQQCGQEMHDILVSSTQLWDKLAYSLDALAKDPPFKVPLVAGTSRQSAQQKTKSVSAMIAMTRAAFFQKIIEYLWKHG